MCGTFAYGHIKVILGSFSGYISNLACNQLPVKRTKMWRGWVCYLAYFLPRTCEGR